MTAGVVYDDPTTGRPVLIIIHQAIYIKGLKHNLLCPMQLHHNGISVNEHPKHCTPIPTREDHSILFEDGNYFIPLSIHGVTSYFPTRTPTKEEALKFRDEGDYVSTAQFGQICDSRVVYPIVDSCDQLNIIRV